MRQNVCVWVCVWTASAHWDYMNSMPTARNVNNIKIPRAVPRVTCYSSTTDTSHTQTHTHTHTHTHTLSLSLSLSHSFTHTLSLSLSHAHKHTHKHISSSSSQHVASHYYTLSIFGTLLQMNMCIILHAIQNLFHYTCAVLYCGGTRSRFLFMKSAADVRKTCFYFLVRVIGERWSAFRYDQPNAKPERGLQLCWRYVVHVRGRASILVAVLLNCT